MGIPVTLPLSGAALFVTRGAYDGRADGSVPDMIAPPAGVTGLPLR